ncbi:uncharacterized protein LOC122401700 [Colletes gigas]|uniref:uncharacterized protein LOC122401700 n=1 Tax=Colletes gigas TaxID=935657 RepID=UPI001C9B090F|nr:uncharacterized protein LOC122401700 [Colletes gigas]
MENEPESRVKHKVWRKYFGWIEDISVEPTMWLYMMAYMVTSVVEQALFVYKSCRVDHGYSEEICAKLNDNNTIKAEVQRVFQWECWGATSPFLAAVSRTYRTCPRFSREP